MNDAELRSIVRAAVARHLGQPVAPNPMPAEHRPRAHDRPRAPEGGGHAHPSHQLYVTVVNVDNACVIEPTVSCDHCGYCRSHGH